MGNIIVDILVLIYQLTYANIVTFFRFFVPLKPKSIRGKVALITGTGHGIGRQTAIRLAQQGAKLAMLDIDETNNAETAEIVSNLGGTCRAYKCDVTKRKEVADVAARVRDDLGQVDILVNNAGIMICKSILDLSEKEIQKTMDVNILAHFWRKLVMAGSDDRGKTVKEFLPYMLARNSGNIVNICSMASKAGTPLLTDYCASKYAASGFTEALNAELVRMNKTGVKCTSVYPMFVDTKLVTGLADRVDFRDRFGKFIKPEHVAEKIVDGIRADQRYIYIPSHMWISDAMNLIIPLRGRKAFSDFLDVGFFEKKTK